MNRIIFLLIFISNTIMNAQNTYLNYSKASVLDISQTTKEYKVVQFEDTLKNRWYFSHKYKDKSILPSFGLQFMTRSKNTITFSLCNFSISKQNNITALTNDSLQLNNKLREYNSINTHIAVKVEYQYNFFKNKDRRLAPSIAGSIMPYYYSAEYNPNQLTRNNFSYKEAAILVSIVPQLTYYFQKNFFLNTGFIVNLARFGISNVNNSDSHIATNNRSISVFDFNALNGYSLRIGVGYKI